MKLVVVTPWYPTPEQPFGGLFVRDWTRARGLDPSDVVTLHLHAVDADQAVTRVDFDDEVGAVVRVTVPLAPSVPRTQAATTYARAAREAGVAELFTGAHAVHLHVALPSGVAVLDFIDPSSAVVLVEHASYTPALLNGDASARMYGRVVARAHTVLTAGRPLAAMLREAYPANAAAICASGNPVAIQSFPLRSPRGGARSTSLLYVGNILESKGVLRAVDALAEWRSRHGDGDLTLLGGGPAVDAVRRRAASQGVADHVHVRESGTREEVSTAMREADVLVHLSNLETFGIAPIEAICSGLPVVITRCGGPEQTLADAAERNAAVFVKLNAEATSVADAIESALAASSSVPWADVRSGLEARYGNEAFRERLVRVEAGGQWADAVAADAPRILVAALGSVGNRRALPVIDAALAQGAIVDVIALEPVHILLADRRATLHVLWPRVLRSPVRFLEYVVLRAVPIAVINAAIWVASHSPLSDDFGDGRVTRALSKLRLRWMKGTRWIHENLAERVWYQWTSSRPYTRSLFKRWPQVSTTQYDVVAYMDPKALHLAWMLAQASPDTVILKHPSAAAITSTLTRL